MRSSISLPRRPRVRPTAFFVLVLGALGVLGATPACSSKDAAEDECVLEQPARCEEGRQVRCVLRDCELATCERHTVIERQDCSGGLSCLARASTVTCAPPDTRPSCRTDAVALTEPGVFRGQVVDLDGDGQPDLVTHESNQGDRVRTWIARKGEGVVAKDVFDLAPYDPWAVVDVDRDGVPDIASATDGTLRWRRGLGDGRLDPPLPLAEVPEPIRTLIAHDMNGDGHAELVFLADGAPARVVDLAERTVVPVPETTVPPRITASSAPLLGAGAPLLGAGDLDGDGRADLVLASDDRQEIRIVRGTPDGYAAPTDVAIGADVNALVVLDLEGNGRARVAVATAANGLELVDGAGQRTPVERLPVLIDSLHVVDLDGDGKQDLVAVPAGAESMELFTSDGARLQRQGAFDYAGAAASFVGVADLDGDGARDVLVSDGQRVLRAPASCR